MEMARRILYILIGLVLMAAAIAKGWWDAAAPLTDRSLFDNRFIVLSVSIFELVVGSAFVAGYRQKWFRPVVISLFTTFAAVALLRMINHHSSCHCFGAVSLNPRHMLGLDILTVALLACVAPGEKIGRASRLNVFLLLLLTGSGLFTSIWYPRLPKTLAIEGIAPPESNSVTQLEPSTWTQKPLQLAAHINVGEHILRDRWIILLVRNGCPDCEGAVALYDAQYVISKGNGPRLALVEIPSYEPPGRPLLNSHALVGYLSSDRRWIARTPIAILLQDGIVQQVREGEDARSPDPAWWAPSY
jgi:hypothetical protein